MANARWAADRERRNAEEPILARELAKREVLGLLPTEEGDWVATVTIQTNDGKTRRWRVCRGARRDQIRLDGCENDHGWSWFFAKLRQKISIY